MSINDYILKIKAIIENLSTVGQFVSDEGLILYILGGVVQEHDPVVINLTSRCDKVTLQQTLLLTSTIILNLASTIKATTTNLVDLQTIITVAEVVVWGACRDFNRPTCQLCGRQGHAAIHCHHRLIWHLISRISTWTEQPTYYIHYFTSNH